jgi:RES domain-containing protein
MLTISDCPSSPSRDTCICTIRRESIDTLQIYRIISSDQVDRPFSGAGSDSGGRWTSEGTPGVYASLTPSTALLEFLAHLKQDVPDRLFLASGWLPRQCLFVPTELPADWNQRPYRAHVRRIGDDWSISRRSLALHVPSALCPLDGNVIINPEHGDFRRLVIGTQIPISLDDRLRAKTYPSAAG